MTTRTVEPTDCIPRPLTLSDAALVALDRLDPNEHAAVLAAAAGEDSETFRCFSRGPMNPDPGRSDASMRRFLSSLLDDAAPVPFAVTDRRGSDSSDAE